MVKLVIYPEFRNVLSETLRTYTILVMVFIVGQKKSVMRKVWKMKPCSAILDVPPRNSSCKESSCSFSISVATSLSWHSQHLERSLSL